MNRSEILVSNLQGRRSPTFFLTLFLFFSLVVEIPLKTVKVLLFSQQILLKVHHQELAIFYSVLFFGRGKMDPGRSMKKPASFNIHLV